MHGYPNTDPRMAGIYLAVGAGVKPGNAGTVRNTDVAGRVKDEATRREFAVELCDERIERGAFEPQSELGDAAFEEFGIAEGGPVGGFHFAHGSRLRGAVSRLPVPLA